ncbi:MAG: hypothetical protein K9G33_01915 [Sneathiella sp.]|nr:hypothetical protein [Sneathiella sp.]
MHWVIERILVGRPDRQTISKYTQGADRYLGIMLLFSAALLGLAVTQPMITASGVLGLIGSHSLLTAAVELLKTGQGVLALLVLVLTVLLPIALLSTAFDLWYKHELQEVKFVRKARLLRQLGRLWFVSFASILIAIYLATRANAATILHLAVYYLVISLALQKLVVARMVPMINAVTFVDDDEV